MADREAAKEKDNKLEQVAEREAAAPGREEEETNTRFSSDGKVPGVAGNAGPARSSASELAYTEDKPRSAGVKLKTEYINREKRFTLKVDENSHRCFLGLPVRNSMTEYDEYYEIDKETFERFKADPALALPMLEQAKARQIDHLLLYKPGSERGVPD